MEILWHGLLVGCVFTSSVFCRTEDAVQPKANPNPDEFADDIVAAEDHEHHRIIIVVPKEMPQHVNHVHMYKLADKGIPLIHSGKVVHDHKHSGKVAHDHGHAGMYGHQHKHAGYLGHQHFGDKLPSGGKPAGGRHQYDPYHPSLHTAAHKLHLQHHQQLQHLHGGGGGARQAAFPQQQQQQQQQLVQGGRGRPTSGQLQYVPSSKPHGLGSFVPAEIQQYVEGHYNGAAPVPKQFLQQQQQRYVVEPDAPATAEDAVDVDDDEGGGENPPSPYNLIQLRVPEQHGQNVIKHVDIDLTNNVAKLKTSAKQPVTAKYKAVTQYNQVIGHGRAVPTQTPEDEFDEQSEDDDVGGGGGGGGGGKDDVGGGGDGGGGGSANGGGEVSMEDVGYRFGEGYRLAVGVGDSRDFSAPQEQDEEETDDFKEPSDGVEDDEPSDGQAYSSQVYMQQ